MLPRLKRIYLPPVMQRKQVLPDFIWMQQNMSHLHPKNIELFAITGGSILMKFDKARCTLWESLKRVEEIIPQVVACQIMGLVGELGGTVFALDQLEKAVGVSVITLLQKERKFNSNSNDCIEHEIFHQAALKLGITSSRAALTENGALEKLIERAQAEEDKRKESIVAFLLHLVRKYSKLFRSDVTDDNDSQGLTPCSLTISCETNGGPLRCSCLNSTPSTSSKMG